MFCFEALKGRDEARQIGKPVVQKPGGRVPEINKMTVW